VLGKMFHAFGVILKIKPLDISKIICYNRNITAYLRAYMIIKRIVVQFSCHAKINFKYRNNIALDRAYINIQL